MRITSKAITSDEKLREMFNHLADDGRSFHPVDVEEVFRRYVARSETMFGKEMQRQFQQTLHAKWNKKKSKKFEQLRAVKRKKTAERKLLNNDNITRDLFLQFSLKKPILYSKCPYFTHATIYMPII